MNTSIDPVLWISIYVEAEVKHQVNADVEHHIEHEIEIEVRAEAEAEENDSWTNARIRVFLIVLISTVIWWMIHRLVQIKI